MANNQRSKGFYVMIIIFIIVLALFAYFGIRELNKRTTADPVKVGELELQNKQMELEIAKYKSEQNKKTWLPWGITTVVVLAIAWILVEYFKAKFAKQQRGLTIDEAKEKGYPLVEKITGEKAIWCRADSYERRIGENKVYFLVYGFAPMINGSIVFWNATKIIAVINDDWDCGRIENIKQGTDLLHAVKFIIGELEIKGFSIQKDKKLSDLEYITELAKGKQAEAKVLGDLGIGGN